MPLVREELFEIGRIVTFHHKKHVPHKYVTGYPLSVKCDMGKIRKSIRINAKPEDVFAYIEDVDRRGNHMLGMGRDFHPEILSENAMGVGATYRWSGTMYGVKFGWTEVVTKWVKNREKVNHSIEGMRIDVSWTLSPEDGGTLLTEAMDYDLGYSLLGRLVDWLWAERYCSKGIEADFQHMKEELEKPGEFSEGGRMAAEVMT